MKGGIRIVAIIFSYSSILEYPVHFYGEELLKLFKLFPYDGILNLSRWCLDKDNKEKEFCFTDIYIYIYRIREYIFKEKKYIRERKWKSESAFYKNLICITIVSLPADMKILFLCK